MIDPKLLRQALPEVKARLQTRGANIPAEFEEWEASRKKIQVSVEGLQAERNVLAKAIGQAKAKGQACEDLLAQSEGVNTQLLMLQQEYALYEQKITEVLQMLPNLPHATTPIGKDESENVEIRRHGEPRSFSFPVKDHVALGEALEMMDFDLAAKLSGARFVVLRRKLAALHRALIQFMLDTHTREHGYEELYVPYLVKDEAFFGTGQLPKFAEDFFKTKEPFSLNLIPTAEVSLTNTVSQMILDEGVLPMRLTAHTPCFRSEAGSYGRDTRGMIRQHQFEKVELVQVVHPEKGLEALDELVGHAEVILQKLGLPYRVMSLCTGDMGFSAAKTYDLEVWLPSQNTYREISSCSLCTDFQARRMSARYKDQSTGKNEFVHTLNGSGLAVGRTLVALLENGQQESGAIHVPQVLHRYLDFVTL